LHAVGLTNAAHLLTPILPQVELWGRVPPIEKLDATLGSLKNCKRVPSQCFPCVVCPLTACFLRPARSQQAPGALQQQHWQD